MKLYKDQLYSSIFGRGSLEDRIRRELIVRVRCIPYEELVYPLQCQLSYHVEWELSAHLRGQYEVV